MAEHGADRLKAIAEALKKGETSGDTVRTLLSWFDAQRRGYWVVDTIRKGLDEAGLRTEPDFESAYVDSIVEFRLLEAETDEEPPAAVPGHLAGSASISLTASGTLSVQPPPQSSHPLSPSSDPTFRVSKLAAANQTPVSVKPDSPLAEAVTIMLTKDYSQLPVMTSDREVKGAISWRSIACRLALKKDGATVRDFMDPVDILPSDASLFVAVKVIVEKQYVLVRAADNRIVGIVTASDVSEQFQTLSEPFLLLSEIENDLRRVLQEKFSVQELATAKDPSDTARTISSVHNMTFGEYIALLENPSNWTKLNTPLDRATFVKQLREVRDIRNDVMHFDPDGIPSKSLTTLREFSKFMQRLRSLEVT